MSQGHDSDCNHWRVIFVLGMHRSGTSCLMACLEQCGVEVGNVQRMNVDQPRGNLEQEALMRINDRLLARAGGNWSDPPATDVVPTDDELIEMADLLAILRGAGPGAVKDPRVIFTLDAWLPLVPHPAMIATFRHPAAVAESLRDRDGMTTAAAYGLWRKYNERLVELHREHGFPLVEFDLSDHEAYCAVIAAIAAECGLVPRVGAIAAVVEQAGVRQTLGPDGPVPEECVELYSYLRQHRHGGRVQPGTPAAERLQAGMAYTESRLISGRQALARKMWLAARSSPRPVRFAVRPVTRVALRVLHRLPSRR